MHCKRVRPGANFVFGVASSCMGLLCAAILMFGRGSEFCTQDKTAPGCHHTFVVYQGQASVLYLKTDFCYCCSHRYGLCMGSQGRRGCDRAKNGCVFGPICLQDDVFLLTPCLAPGTAML